jgi:hypothetical protein
MPMSNGRRQMPSRVNVFIDVLGFWYCRNMGYQKHNTGQVGPHGRRPGHRIQVCFDGRDVKLRKIRAVSGVAVPAPGPFQHRRVG